MAQQQIQFAETIRAMKLAMKRRPDDTDSDDSVREHTNRGNKLKRGAKHVQQSRMDDSGGLSYKKKITHAGYTRHIISTNPPLFDEDGDPYSPLSSDNEYERFAEPIEDNPFGQVQLDMLLRPLTSAAELPSHPSLSHAYKSKALTELAQDALGMLRHERATLWKAKRLLQRFRGDTDWVPVATFETAHDEVLLDGDGSATDPSIVPSVTTEQPLLEGVPSVEPPLENGAESESKHIEEDKAEAMEGVEAVDMAESQTMRAEEEAHKQDVDESKPNGNINNDTTPAAPDVPDDQAMNPAITDLTERETAASETASTVNTHAMTTRARARSPAERSDHTLSPSPSDSASVPAVNPWFVAPSSSLGDLDLGLPANEAEETRKILLMYAQKQEQIVRSLNSLYMGLQKADRLRKFVYDSCKAEGHLVPDGKGNMVTEMSDGEDWYDVADWNLQPWELKDGKLEKGKDEIEDVEEEGRRGPRRRRVNRM